MAKKKSSSKAGKRNARGKVGDLPVTRGRGAAVKGGALINARMGTPPDLGKVFNPLSQSTKSSAG